MLVVVRIEFESFVLQALPDGLELFLVLESHPIQQVIEQRGGLNFIESAEFIEPFFMSASCSDMPTGCQDFHS